MERKWAMRKIAAGDWLLPSDDLRTYYRLHSYEDGAAHGLVGVDYDYRTFWRTARIDADKLHDYVHLYGQLPDPFDGLWSDVDSVLPSRAVALQRAMEDQGPPSLAVPGRRLAM